MNDKTKSDLLILSAVAVLVLLATVGVVLRFGQTGKSGEVPESKRIGEWRTQLKIFERRGSFAEAEIVVGRILKVLPEDVEMLRTAGRISFLNQKYKDAYRLLKRVLLMDPENITDRCNLALSLAGTGQNGQALAELRRAYRDSGGASFVYRLFYDVAARSNYTGDSIDDIAVTEVETPEGLLELPPQKGTEK